MKERTRIVHPPQVRPPEDNEPLVAPIYQSVKFGLPTVAETLRSLRGERDGFFYSRSANPTTRQLEQTLAALQGREDAIVCGSGVGAVAQTLLGLLKAGDHLLCFAETYGPTRSLIRRMLQRYGVQHTMLSIEDDAGIERVLSSTPTRLVIFESPTNPITRIADIAHITELRPGEWRADGARQHAGRLPPARRHRCRPVHPQPDQVRLRPRRRDGRRGDRQRRADQAAATGLRAAGRCARPACRVPDPARVEDLSVALRGAMRRRAEGGGIPGRTRQGGSCALPGFAQSSAPRAGESPDAATSARL